MTGARAWGWVTAAVVVYALLHWGTFSSPPLGRDAWRESDVLMVARNFCVEKTPLLEPRIDARGEGPGITGMEFPILNALDGALECRGFEPVRAARVVTFLFALLGIAALFSLVEALVSRRAAVLASLVYAFSPLIFHYARQVQPDVPAVSLALLSLAVLERALRGETRRGLVLLAGALMGLAALIKLPALVFGLPALVLVRSRRADRQWLAEPTLWAFALLALVPAALWYRHAHALQDRYGIHYFYLGSDLPSLFRAWTSGLFWRRIFIEQLFDVYAFPLASLCAVVALFLRGVSPVARAFAVATLAYVLLAGFQASHHFYYGIVCVPAVAILAGIALDRALARARRPKRWIAGIAVVLAIYAVGRTRRWLPPQGAAEQMTAARERLDRLLPRDARVLVFSRGDPKLLYWLDRKGWVGAADHELGFLDHLPPAPIVALDGLRLPPQTRAELQAALLGRGYAVMSDSSAVELLARLPDVR